MINFSCGLNFDEMFTQNTSMSNLNDVLVLFWMLSYSGAQCTYPVALFLHKQSPLPSTLIIVFSEFNQLSKSMVINFICIKIELPISHYYMDRMCSWQISRRPSYFSTIIWRLILGKIASSQRQWPVTLVHSHLPHSKRKNHALSTDSRIKCYSEMK